MTLVTGLIVQKRAATLSLSYSSKKLSLPLSLSLSLSLLKNSKTHNSQSLIFPTISFLSRENSHMGTLKYSPNQMGLLLKFIDMEWLSL